MRPDRQADAAQENSACLFGVLPTIRFSEDDKTDPCDISAEMEQDEELPTCVNRLPDRAQGDERP
jgi:hypothetical protein